MIISRFSHTWIIHKISYKGLFLEKQKKGYIFYDRKKINRIKYKLRKLIIKKMYDYNKNFKQNSIYCSN